MIKKVTSCLMCSNICDVIPVAPIGPAEDVTEFSDVEDQVIDSDIKYCVVLIYMLSCYHGNSKPRDSKEEALEQGIVHSCHGDSSCSITELTLADQVAKKEIIQLEQNILEWQKVLGVPSHIGECMLYGECYSMCVDSI